MKSIEILESIKNISMEWKVLEVLESTRSIVSEIFAKSNLAHNRAKLY